LRPDSHNVATRPATARHAVAGRGSMSVRHQGGIREKRKLWARLYNTAGVLLENGGHLYPSKGPSGRILIRKQSRARNKSSSAEA